MRKVIIIILKFTKFPFKYLQHVNKMFRPLKQDLLL